MKTGRNFFQELRRFHIFCGFCSAQVIFAGNHSIISPGLLAEDQISEAVRFSV